MVKVDYAQWPVVYMEVDGLGTVADMQEFIDEMDALLARNEKFGLIMHTQITDSEYKDFRREKEAQKMSNTWLKENRSRIGAQCIAIASVLKASGLMKVMKPIAKISMKRQMGTNGDIFFTQEEAAVWLAEQMKNA